MITELDLILNERPVARKKGSPSRRSQKGRLSSRSLRLLAQSLSRLLSGGVPLVRSLEILNRESKNQSFQSFLSQVKDQIREGIALSEAVMGAVPEYFIQMLEAGELSGTLPEVLKLLSEHLARDEERKRRLIEATAYPALVFILGIASFFILLQFVIPRITQVYQDFGGALPLLTQGIIGLTRFSIPLAGLFFFSLLGFGSLLKNRNPYLLSLMTKLPLAGGIIKKNRLARFSTHLSLLLRSGIPILKALDSIGKDSLKEDINHLKAQISEGVSLTDALERVSWISDTSKALIASGEESGKLPEALESIQKEASLELETQIQFLLKIIEPLLIVAIGIGIGFIVVGALLPILEISELIQ